MKPKAKRVALFPASSKRDISRVSGKSSGAYTPCSRPNVRDHRVCVDNAHEAVKTQRRPVISQAPK